jgi:hypothetical protein
MVGDNGTVDLAEEFGDELPVLVRYGRTMLSAQLLEFTVFQLTHLKKKTPADMERAIKKLEGLLKQPPGDASKQLDLDALLLGDLKTAIEIRNVLAHEFLTRFRVEYAIREEAIDMAIAFLDASYAFIGDVQRRLDEEADRRLLEKGIEQPYLDDEEMNDLMEDIKRWAETDPLAEGE